MKHLISVFATTFMESDMAARHFEYRKDPSDEVSIFFRQIAAAFIKLDHEFDAQMGRCELVSRSFHCSKRGICVKN